MLAWHVAIRLCDVLPKGWQLINAQAQPSKNAPPGWKPVQGVLRSGQSAKIPPSAIGNYASGRGVGVSFWISDRRLDWTGEVPSEGSMAAFYLGKCPEGYVYADLLSYAEAEIAKWPTFEEDIKKALQPKTEMSTGGVYDDEQLEHLKGLRQLECLELDGTNITDAGMRHLKGSPQLKDLQIGNTHITDAGLQYISGLTQLQRLSLHNTRITDAGLENLKGLTRLKQLYLGQDPITDAGLKHLKGLTQLEHLSLFNTEITDAGLENLEGMALLSRLYLQRTRITDTGLEHLKGLTQLRKLSLDETQVTDQGVRKLQQALPNCKIEH